MQSSRLIKWNNYRFLRLCAFCVCLSGINAHAADRDADNTKRNQGDENALTPLDQPNNQTDVKTAAALRSAIVARDDLSANAKNIKIIVAQGVATLRGPVASTAEKANIEAVAKGISGITRVDNQLTTKN